MSFPTIPLSFFSIKKITLTFCFALWAAAAFATHNQAGQITYKRMENLGANVFEILLTTYTDSSAAGVDRCTADIEIWGVQGANRIYITTLKNIPRSNGVSVPSCDAPARNGVNLRKRVKRNEYRTTYRFTGAGIYELRYFDVARINDVKNMANSGGTAFYVETQLINNPFVGRNNSVILLNDPIDDACTNQIWTHNPGGYDPDGDSLVYSLVNCRQYNPPDINTPVSCANFQSPGAFGGTFTIDRETGVVTWDTPEQIGVYNIAIRVEEWRNGRLLSYVMRDMAIWVKPCNNKPPVIEAPEEICAFAGELISFDITSYDPDVTFNPPPLPPPNSPDSLYFYLNYGGAINNGPFSVPNSPAVLLLQPNLDPVAAYPIRRLMQADHGTDVRLKFNWQTNCSHIRNSFYQLDLYAHDNFFEPNTNRKEHPTLSANKAIKIYVRPRPVQNLTATAGSRKITLNWDPAECENAIAYDVYRSEGGGGSIIDECCKKPAVPEGYEKIARVEGWENTTFTDDENGQGLEYRSQYCYTIIAVYDDLISCPSTPACVKILRDMPLVTNDSIFVTDPANGKLVVAWQKPDMSKINADFFPPPYTYKLQRAEGVTGTSFVEMPQNFAENDTVFVDQNLNTETQSYTYKVKMLASNGQLVSTSDKASSIFVTTIPGNKKIRLVWDEYVPWLNSNYEVYRADEKNGTFVKIADVPGSPASQHTFVDLGADLPNGLQFEEDYCYFVRSTGSYNTPGVKDPLINDSQIVCDVPLDETPPCLPDSATITSEGNCEALQVRFTYTKPDTLCGDDVAFFSLYFSKDTVAFTNPERVYKTANAETLEFTFPAPTIAGCFALTATDANGNESGFSHKFCYDNCPVLDIPNVFSVKSGGLQVIFQRSIVSMRFRVYDRWGVLVGESTDPNLLWDGKYKTSGRAVVPGQYFYFLEYTLDNLANRPFTRTGSVTVVP